MLWIIKFTFIVTVYFQGKLSFIFLNTISLIFRCLLTATADSKKQLKIYTLVAL